MLENALPELTQRGEIVFDPLLGSSSTLIEAHSTGCVCRGIEIDSRYVDVAIRRLKALTGKKALNML